MWNVWCLCRFINVAYITKNGPLSNFTVNRHSGLAVIT